MRPTALSERGTVVCRACGSDQLHSVLDLGSQPLANRLLSTPDAPDPDYPLHLRLCSECGLGQVGEYVTPWDIFHDYPYLSSMSSSWLRHVADYQRQMRSELELGASDLVVEIASNDGHLLKAFHDGGTRVLGVEPAANVAAIAERAGVPTECAFFGRETARRIRSEHGAPVLVVANNVMAHVPDLDDFVSGLAELSGPETTITIENPSLVELLVHTQFDTIYHEHFSYLTAHSVRAVSRKHGLDLVRVQRLQTHGGSNRYFLRRGGQPADSSVEDTLAQEREQGLFSPTVWQAFARRSRSAVDGLRGWLELQRGRGRTTAAYGAAAKGNTFLNAVGALAGDLAFVVDASPAKQSRFLPGSHVPVVAPHELKGSPVDAILILPWNIADELQDSICEISRESQIWVALPEMSRLR